MRKDESWKNFFGDNERYADVINGIGCRGVQYVKPSDLQELDTASKRKARDLLRKTAFGMNFAIIGIENQEEVDYKFPLRNLHYEVNQYEKQAAEIYREIRGNRGKAQKSKKTDEKELKAGEYLYGFKKESRLHPVVTFVLYAGKEPWDGPMCLRDIIDCSDIPETLRGMVADYSINLVDIRRLEDTSVFKTDIKHVFDFIRCSENKEALRNLVTKEPYYQEMDDEAFEVVSNYSNLNGLIEDEEDDEMGGKKNVCKAILDLMADSKEEGREEGLELGMKAVFDTCKSLNVAKEVALEKIKEQFQLTDEVAMEKLQKYW